MRTPALLTAVIVAAALAAAGCGGSDTAGSSADTSTMRELTDTAMTDTMDMTTTGERAVDGEMSMSHLHVTVSGGKVSGDTDPTVEAGSSVMLHVMSDHDDTVHVHGYDEEFDVRAGEEATITFTADIAGRFEVELHETGTKLMDLTVK